MASQLDSLSYLNEGSTRRKEILAKFLDLEIFDQKFKLSKEDSSDMKGAIKKLSDRDYDSEIAESNRELALADTELLHRQRKLEELQEEVQDSQQELHEINRQLDSIPEQVIDIGQVIKKIKKLKQEVSIIEVNLEKKQEVLNGEEAFLQKIENFINGFNIEDINNQKQVADEYKQKIGEIETEIQTYEQQKTTIDHKIELLKNVPCNHPLQNKCHFVSDARRGIDDNARVKIGLNQLTLNKKTITKKLEDINPTKLSEYTEKYYMIQEKKITKNAQVTELKLQIEKDKNRLNQVKSILDSFKEKEQLYEQNKEAIESLDLLTEQKAAFQKKIDAFNDKNEQAKHELMDLYRQVGSLEQKNKELISQKQDFCDLQEEFTAADLFMRCMHPNGISYDIIKKRLPLINDEISKILTNIVDFEVFFENDEKKLDILIKHPKHDARPIEMGSGAEKTITAMAIRLALLNVSTLPKGDVFILDEPGTALDAENMEGFIRILDMIKTQFKTVLLISHLDSLKDIVDRQILIEKNDDRAYVNE